MVSCESTIDFVADAKQAAAVVWIPSASAVLKYEELASVVELDVDGRLEAMVGREGFDGDFVFVFVQLDGLDPSAGVVGDEPVVVEGLG